MHFICTGSIIKSYEVPSKNWCYFFIAGSRKKQNSGWVVSASGSKIRQNMRLMSVWVTTQHSHSFSTQTKISQSWNKLTRSGPSGSQKFERFGTKHPRKQGSITYNLPGSGTFPLFFPPHLCHQATSLPPRSRFMSNGLEQTNRTSKLSWITTDNSWKASRRSSQSASKQLS